MTQKTTLMLKAVLFLTVLNMVMPAVSSAGDITNHSGTICKNYYAGEVALIEYLSYGIRSLKGSTTKVICPLTRNSVSTNGAWVYVDIAHRFFAATTCGVYSYDPTGILLASGTRTWKGAGFHEFAFNLEGTGNSEVWSDYSVVCSIPGNRVGVVLGVDLVDTLQEP